MGASVGYFEAWSLWFQGQDVKGLALYGVPLIWIARAAKIATFLASLVVVIDLFGPGRVIGWASAKAEGRFYPFAFNVAERTLIAVVLACFAAVPVSVTVLMVESVGENNYVLLKFLYSCGALVFGAVAAICISGLIAQLLHLIALALDSERDHAAVRWIAFTVIAVGFHFDLLTS